MSYHLIDEPAQLQACHRCGAQILWAMEGGIEIRADLLPLNLAQEVAALKAGRRTYTLKPGAWKPRLYWRSIHVIEEDPRRELDVLAEHRCPKPPQSKEIR